MYNPNRLSGIRRKTRIRLTPQIPVAVLSDGKLTFDSRHSFAVALAKSQDHRVFYGVFLLAAVQCGTSVVASRDTLLHERTKAGAVGEG